MSENVIVVENLSKRYLIGHQVSASGGRYKYTALRDVLGREIRNFARKVADVVGGRQVVQGDEIEEYWALRDVSFKVEQGEVLGIIGRNGAGKSTLLKILSRITEPTEGRISLRGRVSSLLEVGTGFHPELTGRENIFLNGAILGMTQREIRKKFEEIVAFAEVEKFLDTPVKHYSSGMYVRLAFAVAAHLEPEILIVDEVLAVGDTEFQKKCLGKMNDVAKSEGRTVLFVSHSMDAILRLCTRCVLFEGGRIQGAGDVTAVVQNYISRRPPSPKIVDLSSRLQNAQLAQRIQLTKVALADAQDSWLLPFGKKLSIDLSMEAASAVTDVEVIIGIYSIRGYEVATWSNPTDNVELPVHAGPNTFRIRFEQLRLLPGRYFIYFSVFSNRGFEDEVAEAVQFEVMETAEINPVKMDGTVLTSASVSILG